MKNFIKDAAAALGFPFSQPAAPHSKSSTSNGFAETVTDADLKGMFRRNQAAHAIVADVATDAITEFAITDAEENTLEVLNNATQILLRNLNKDLNKDIQPHTQVRSTLPKLARTLMFTRLYGHCGLLIGYADGSNLDQEVTGSPKLTYLQPIPKPWIKEIVMRKDEDGNLLLPLELDHYEIDIGSATQHIHASRILHFANPSVDEESPEGESSLLCIYDDLKVLKSMTWGAGQAMWRHGGGLTVFIAPESSDSQAQIDAIDEAATNINVATVLTMPPGTGVFTGAPGALNPKNYFDACLQMISIGSRIPQSILRGSVAGSLTASEKDRKDYFELLDNIQKELLTPALTDIITRLQAAGQLPQQEDFIITWESTPIWMKEEQQGKLTAAQTALVEAQTKTEELKTTQASTLSSAE